MKSSTAPTRSQAWFPGRFVRVRNITGMEVLPSEPRRRHGGAVVGKAVIHGTADELRALARNLLAAAARIDPLPAPSADLAA